MSSRVFQARTGHSADNPQLCGLTNTPIQRDDWIMYLVCRGADARPDYQIKVVAENEVEKEYFNRWKKRREKRKVVERDYSLNGQEFRTVYNGKKKNPTTGKYEKNFIWQECVGIDADGEKEWRTVKCWSHIVHAKAAESLGYEVRADKDGKWLTTEAYEGDRAVGSEHTVEAEEENAMIELARAALSEEEAGLVPPSTPEDDGERIAAQAEADAINAMIDAEEEDHRDREDAEALGLTLEEYRRIKDRLS